MCLLLMELDCSVHLQCTSFPFPSLSPFKEQALLMKQANFYPPLLTEQAYGLPLRDQFYSCLLVVLFPSVGVGLLSPASYIGAGLIVPLISVRAGLLVPSLSGIASLQVPPSMMEKIFLCPPSLAEQVFLFPPFPL